MKKQDVNLNSPSLLELKQVVESRQLQPNDEGVAGLAALFHGYIEEARTGEISPYIAMNSFVVKKTLEYIGLYRRHAQRDQAEGSMMPSEGGLNHVAVWLLHDLSVTTESV